MKNKTDIINQLAVSYWDVSSKFLTVLEEAVDEGIKYGNKNIVAKKQYFWYHYYEKIWELDEKDKIYKDSIDGIIKEITEELNRKENDWKKKSLFKRIFKI